MRRTSSSTFCRGAQPRDSRDTLRYQEPGRQEKVILWRPNKNRQLQTLHPPLHLSLFHLAIRSQRGHTRPRCHLMMAAARFRPRNHLHRGRTSARTRSADLANPDW